jgi:uncharacterized RDD family membrane protein YckC
MQQPTDPRLRQAAFRPGWLPLPEPPAKRGNPFLRGLVIALCAVGGLLAPILALPILFDTQPDLGLVWIIPMWFGLAGGIWFGVRVTSHKQRR